VAAREAEEELAEQGAATEAQEAALEGAPAQGEAAELAGQEAPEVQEAVELAALAPEVREVAQGEAQEELAGVLRVLAAQRVQRRGNG